MTDPDPTRKRALAMLALAAALMFALGGLAACGDDDDSDSGVDVQTATEEQTTEEPAPEDEGGGGGGGGDAEAGAQVFADNCEACHGPEGSGGAGPALAPFDDPQAVERQVRNGGGGMPPFEGKLSDQEIEDVVAYVTQDIAGGGN
jgi:Cytochrome c, mono- and diheme variants